MGGALYHREGTDVRIAPLRIVAARDDSEGE